MFGYILWSDPAMTQAIIWSEDQGDLVFFQGIMGEVSRLRKGDCVTFSLEMRDGRRYANDLLKTEQTLEVELADNLQRCAQAACQENAAPDAYRDAANVLTFPTVPQCAEPFGRCCRNQRCCCC